MEGFKLCGPLPEKIDPIQHRRGYDVFLSFRGPDVRNTLVNKLFESLKEVGLHVFLDSERLEKGEDIGTSLEKAIKDSRVHIPIFSPGYASSTWCLKELSLMWTCKAECEGSQIIPLFYNVEPRHVKYPDDERSPYAEELKTHSKRHNKEKIEEWKAALKAVSSLSGWDLASDKDKLIQQDKEDQLIQQVKEYFQAYKIKDLHVAKHAVGLADRTTRAVEELRRITDPTRGVTFGIWGMGGLGKTTFSKSIYNRIHHNFQASCFVADIRAMAKESSMGLRNLQKQILKNLAKCDVDFDCVDQGKIQMKNRLAKIRALVVLDDVDDEEQLDALADDWYGQGSIIIITTRDKEVLKKRQVNKSQAMKGLSPEEGMKLFSWHAFGRESPEKDYGDITQQIVYACDGLPLSLEILGAHLRSERNLTIWNEALQKIQNVDFDKLDESLRISYDALTYNEQQIFLDIACFFIGSPDYCDSSKKFYGKFWKALGRKAVYTSLKILEGKSLIVMEEYTPVWYHGIWPGDIGLEFRMHDHLRDLGRRIVEDEAPDNLHKRSRLWHEEDIISAIGHAEETSTVQGIMWRGMVDLEAEQVDSLLSMRNIKFMFCWNLFLEREITNLPQNLRHLVLSCCKYSEMLSSTESYCPKAIGQLKNLRYLDMSSTRLRFLPIEFGQLLSLEELYLVKCSLIELPHSFGNLIKLKFLDISRNGLKSFPANFSQLRSLEYLNASSNEFEELPALPEGLLYLDVRDSHRLQKLQPISHITRLHTIELGRCPRLTELPKLDTLHSVTKLNLEGCKFLKELPALPPNLTELSLMDCCYLHRMSCMCHMKNLQRLRFNCVSLDELPELEGMQSLEKLELHGWLEKKLSILFPSGLIHLYLQSCFYVKELPCMSHMRHLQTLHLYQCRNLTEIPKLDTMHSLRRLELDNCHDLKKLCALPSGLIYLSVRHGVSLIELQCMSHMRDLETLHLSNCYRLIEIPKLDTMHSLRRLILDCCSKLEKLPALPAGPIHVTTNGCFRLQNNCCTDKRKRPVVDVNVEIPAVDVNKEFVLLDGKRRRVSEQSEVS